MIREHHFYVSIAKHLFLHPEYGVVSVIDPIKIADATGYNLSPIILYGITVAGLPIRWVTFSRLDNPKAFIEVLQEAWQDEESLRGRPDILRINSHLLQSSPCLAEELEKLNIQLAVTKGKEQALAASLRSAQQFCKWLPFFNNNIEPVSEPILNSLISVALENNKLHMYTSEKSVNIKLKQWLSMPFRDNIQIQNSHSSDWIQGEWLSAWEKSLPPDQKRYFKYQEQSNSYMLVTGEDGSSDSQPSWNDYYHNSSSDIAKHLLGCWPNSISEVAKQLKVSLKELQWFLTEQAPLDHLSQYELEKLLGIEYDDYKNEMVAKGHYVLIAKKEKSLKAIYEIISNGWNARPCEIIPIDGTADPSWRYFLINTYCIPPSIVMAPRGSKIAESMPKLLANYYGIQKIPIALYRDFVSTCSRACVSVDANIREMQDFVSKHHNCWVNGSWLP